LLDLQRVLFSSEWAVVVELVVLARRISNGCQCLNAPIETGLAFAALAARIALNDNRQKPAVCLALNVAANDAAGCSGLSTSGYFTDTG